MRLIPRIDRDPRIVALAQTPTGKAAALAVFAALLALGPIRFRLIVEIVAVLGLMSLFPSHRRVVLSLGVVYWAVVHPIWDRTDVVKLVVQQEGLGTLNSSYVYRIVLLVTLALFALGLWIIYRKGPSLRLPRPLLTLYLSYAALLGCVSLAPLSGLWRVLAWAFVAAAAGYLWCFSYALLDRNAPGRDPVSREVGTFLPFWTLSHPPQPYPKGAAYLRRIEAKSPEDLAVCQLKAIKLLAWSLVLVVASELFDLFVQPDRGARAARLATVVWRLGHVVPLPHLRVPAMTEVFARSVERQPFPWYVCWATLLARMLLGVIQLASGGGFIIAICRMAGFRALRNTCRPLQARTIGDSWNRYFYYYKELLVDCFFYPTFVRYFKRHPRLRVVAATFAAVGLGNFLYNVFSSPRQVVEVGLWRSLWDSRVLVFQYLVAATSISVSLLRGRPTSLDRKVTFGALRAVAGVWLYGMLLDVFWFAGSRAYGFGDSFRFLFHLFGIRLG